MCTQSVEKLNLPMIMSVNNTELVGLNMYKFQIE